MPFAATVGVTVAGVLRPAWPAVQSVQVVVQRWRHAADGQRLPVTQSDRLIERTDAIADAVQQCADAPDAAVDVRYDALHAQLQGQHEPAAGLR